MVAGGSMLQLFQAARQARQTSKMGHKTHVVSLVRNQKDLIFLKELLESGKIVPVIDGCHPINKTTEALRYFEKIHPKRKLIIIVGPNSR